MKNLNLFKFIATASFVFAMASSFAQTSNPDYKFSLGEVKYFIKETKGTAKAQNDTTFYNLYRVGKTKKIGREIKSVIRKSSKEVILEGEYRVNENSIVFYKGADTRVLSYREYVQDSNGLLSVQTNVIKTDSVPAIASAPDLVERDYLGNEIFTSVDQMPQYPGGINALRQFLASSITYPDEAIENEVNGTVIATFIVETDGAISNIEISKKLGYGCDEEVIRVLKKTPKKWTPGAVNGKPVRTRFRLPVSFNTAG